MGKILLAMIVAFGIGATFVSCGKNETIDEKENRIENEYKQQLVGKWKVIGQKSSGNVYNLLYRLDGDFYVTFNADGTAKSDGEATAHGYYDGGSEFVHYDLSDYLTFAKWYLGYDSVTGTHLSLFKTATSSASYHGVTFNSDGTIWLWYTSTSKWYYILKKVG